MNRIVIEEWRDVQGYEGLYSVSNFGRVKSHDRKISNGRALYNKKGRILKNTKASTGYWKVELVKNQKIKSHKVHRLVAKEFMPEIKGKNLINHIDGDPLNNHADNLEWCTQKENMSHAYETGLIKSNFTMYKEDILNEYINNKTMNVVDLSKKYDCSDSSIRRYLRQKGIKIRGISEAQTVFNIDRKRMVFMFEQGKSNKEIAKEFDTNTDLIGTYKYKYKKGELIV